MKQSWELVNAKFNWIRLTWKTFLIFLRYNSQLNEINYTLFRVDCLQSLPYEVLETFSPAILFSDILIEISQKLHRNAHQLQFKNAIILPSYILKHHTKSGVDTAFKFLGVLTFCCLLPRKQLWFLRNIYELHLLQLVFTPTNSIGHARIDFIRPKSQCWTKPLRFWLHYEIFIIGIPKIVSGSEVLKVKMKFLLFN